MTALLFDVSSNSAHPIHWGSVKQAGYLGGWVKATEGATYVNPDFAGDYPAAKAAGLIVGPYHWISPGSTAQAQVNNLLTAIKKYYAAGDLLIALDWEQNGDSHALLHQVRSLLHLNGHGTITYTYPSFWTQNGSPSCAQCAAQPLWFASYRSTPPAAPAPWTHIDVWQYAGTSAAIPGISGLSDSSRLLVPLTDIRSALPQPSAALRPDARGISTLHPAETLGQLGQHFFNDGNGGAIRIRDFYGNRGRLAAQGIVADVWRHPKEPISLLIPKTLK